MKLLDRILPSKEKIFFVLLIALAANFPFIGTYHTDAQSTYYLQTNRESNFQQTIERTMHLNPIFWFPYIYAGGGDVLAKTMGGQEDLIIPSLEFSKNPKPLPILATLIYWYVITSVLVMPLNFKKEG